MDKQQTRQWMQKTREKNQFTKTKSKTLKRRGSRLSWSVYTCSESKEEVQTMAYFTPLHTWPISPYSKLSVIVRLSVLESYKNIAACSSSIQLLKDGISDLNLPDTPNCYLWTFIYALIFLQEGNEVIRTSNKEQHSRFPELFYGKHTVSINSYLEKPHYRILTFK